MSRLLMSSFLSMKMPILLIIGLLLLASLYACQSVVLNNPYSDTDSSEAVLYQSFSERPKHFDPAMAYSENEFAFIAQIYEPPLQYHYLKRPYQLVPLTTQTLPEVVYLNAKGEHLAVDSNPEQIAFTDYILTLKPGIRYQPHPAFAKTPQGEFVYHHLTQADSEDFNSLNDFSHTDTRELLSDDYVYQIKRLAHPKNQSPIAEIMKNYIVGFDDFAKQTKDMPKSAIKDVPMIGAEVVNPYQYRIRIKGKYPQFIYWLAMPFFSPMPWEADVFYNQPGLNEKNITLDWFPIGTGAYYLAENNPNRRMVLQKNPNFHPESYPTEGEPDDKANGLLDSAGQRLPFIDKVVFVLEKETIPYWAKFLQGYYDASGIASDNFDQAIQFTGSGGLALTADMQEKGIQLQTAVQTSSFYLGFNMLDAQVGGDSASARKLRQAIAIAVDQEEFISIFMNGRGIAAQGVLPPGIFGFADGKAGINPYVYDWVNGQLQRKSIAEAKQLLTEAGFSNGVDPKTQKPLILYFDTTATSVDDKPRMAWYRKQFDKIGIQLVIRATDYNRFQEKIRAGNAQIFAWGWNADYPDPENFYFLLYGPNGKVKQGGENAGNYSNPEFDRLFEQMRNMDNSPERFQIIQKMQAIVQRDAPWVFGLHPKQFSLFHRWFGNLKANLMANNELKYRSINTALRTQKRLQWNRPVVWPLLLAGLVGAALILPAYQVYRRRTQETLS